jgi:hypothetical protein
MNPLDYALRYIRRGWSPVPIPKGQKGPRIRGWQNLRITEADAPKYFNAVGNVGIILGEASGGLADVDLDCPEAVRFAPNLLPETKSIFGRPSKPQSHRLYHVSVTARSLHFKDPITSDTLLELRADSGKQTVFPPSTHPSGERIEWACDGDPLTINYAILKKAVSNLAARCLIARYLPAVTNTAELLSALPGIELRVAERIQEWSELPRPPRARSPNPRSTNTTSSCLSLQSMPSHLRGRQIRNLAGRALYSFARNDLNDIVRELTAQKKPGRANLLFKKSIRMGVLIAQGHIDQAEVRAALHEASTCNGLVAENGEHDVLRNIEKGFACGATKAQEPPFASPVFCEDRTDQVDEAAASQILSDQADRLQSSSDEALLMSWRLLASSHTAGAGQKQPSSLVSVSGYLTKR